MCLIALRLVPTCFAGAVVASMVCTAIGTYLSLYPAMLLVPIYLLLLSAKAHEVRVNRYGDAASAVDTNLHMLVPICYQGTSRVKGNAALLPACAASFIVALSLLMYLSHTLSGGWDFVEVRYRSAVCELGSLHSSHTCSFSLSSCHPM